MYACQLFRTHSVVILLIASIMLVGSVRAADKLSEANREKSRQNMQFLGVAMNLYIRVNGKLPSKCSELYREGFVRDLNRFVHPASSKKITSVDQIDEQTDYAIATEPPKTTPARIVWEKYGFNDGMGLEYHSDRTFKSVKLAPPPKPKNFNSDDVSGTSISVDEDGIKLLQRRDEVAAHRRSRRSSGRSSDDDSRAHGIDRDWTLMQSRVMNWSDPIDHPEETGRDWFVFGIYFDLPKDEFRRMNLVRVRYNLTGRGYTSKGKKLKWLDGNPDREFGMALRGDQDIRDCEIEGIFRADDGALVSRRMKYDVQVRGMPMWKEARRERLSTFRRHKEPEDDGDKESDFVRRRSDDGAEDSIRVEDKSSTSDREFVDRVGGGNLSRDTFGRSKDYEVSREKDEDRADRTDDIGGTSISVDEDGIKLLWPQIKRNESSAKPRGGERPAAGDKPRADPPVTPGGDDRFPERNRPADGNLSRADDVLQWLNERDQTMGPTATDGGGTTPGLNIVPEGPADPHGGRRPTPVPGRKPSSEAIAEADAMNFEGQELMKLGNWPDAEVSYLEAIRLNPNNATYQNNLGVVLVKQGKWADAEAPFRLAVRMKPNSVNLANLGRVMQHFKEYAVALALMERAVKLDPKRADLHNRIGVILYLQGHWNKAIEAYKKAVGLSPNNAGYVANLGQAYYRLGNIDQAHRKAVRARELGLQQHDLFTALRHGN